MICITPYTALRIFAACDCKPRIVCRICLSEKSCQPIPNRHVVQLLSDLDCVCIIAQGIVDRNRKRTKCQLSGVKGTNGHFFGVNGSRKMDVIRSLQGASDCNARARARAASGFRSERNGACMLGYVAWNI